LLASDAKRLFLAGRGGKGGRFAGGAVEGEAALAPCCAFELLGKVSQQQMLSEGKKRSERFGKYIELYRDASFDCSTSKARLAQSAEHQTLNLVVVGSSPTLGALLFFCSFPFAIPSLRPLQLHLSSF
jgi:hypothetical protein